MAGTIGNIPSSREKIEMMAHVINSKTGKFRLDWRSVGDPPGEYRKGPAAYMDRMSAEEDAGRIQSLYETVEEVRVESV